VTEYRLVEELRVEQDVEDAYIWYENEQPGLGDDFLDELYACYQRAMRAPLGYQDLDGGSAERCSGGSRTACTSRSMATPSSC
jgi:hypothetical protein